MFFSKKDSWKPTTKSGIISKVGDNVNHDHSINWSDKVKSLDKTFRDEIGIEGENEAKHILIKVQTKSAEPIEPAFIVGEDESSRR